MQCAQKASAARPVAARQAVRIVPRLVVRPSRAAVAEAPSATAQSSDTKVRAPSGDESRSRPRSTSRSAPAMRAPTPIRDV